MKLPEMNNATFAGKLRDRLWAIAFTMLIRAGKAHIAAQRDLSEANPVVWFMVTPFVYISFGVSRLVLGGMVKALSPNQAGRNT